MKNISIKIPICLAATMILLAACTEELADKSTDGTHAIAFAPATETRAAVNGSGNLGDFKVWGWYGAAGAINKNVFDGKTIQAPSWTYDGGYQYWIPGNTYNFYGVYPAGLPENSVTVTNDGNITVTNFDCSKTGADAVDLMTAKKTDITYTSGSQVLPVELSFGHELSKLKFAIKTKSHSIKLKNVWVYGMVNTGTFSTTSPVWSQLGQAVIKDNTPYKVSQNLGISVGVNQTYSLFGDFMIIPQDINDGVKIELDYIYDNEPDIVYNTSVSLNAGSIKSWIKSQSYSYVVTIPENTADVSLSVSVLAWDEKNTSVQW